MSNNFSSSPSGKESGDLDGDRSIGGRDAGTNQLTPQQLREQRLSRFEGKSNQGANGESQLKEPSLSSSQTKLSVTSTTSSPIDKRLKPAPIYTNSSNNNDSNSNSTDINSTKYIGTTEKPQANLLKSPNLFGIEVNTDTSDNDKTIETIDYSGNNEGRVDANVDFAVAAAEANTDVSDDDRTIEACNLHDNGMRVNDNEDFMVAATFADKENEDLQTALALSMGLPVPPSKYDSANFEVDPLPAFETGREGKSTPEVISCDMLVTAAMVAATAPALGTATGTTIAPSTHMRIEEDETDAAMENDDRKPAAVVKTTSSCSPSNSPSRILRSNPQHFSGRVRTWYETASSYNVLDFHDCMWDKGVTTENDQKRWLAQGIQFKDEHDDRKSSRTRTAINDRTDTSSLLATIISGPGVWCLTQQHGGPCGVLASIQAELLSILLFGPRTVHPLSMISIDFPDDLSTEFTTAAPDMSRQRMRQVLASSMGMILARSSLMSSATLQDDNITENDGKNNDVNDNLAALMPRPEPIVKLILPKNELWNTTTCLEWQHLEPWDCSNGGGGVSEHLLTYTISLNKHPSGVDGNDVKRQRIASIGRGDDIDYTCKELAHATAQFLLETNSLNWFQRAGGVLLMVMSIAASRGIPKTQGDMDDLTAKLTTNFGHCSQELINLLLTGQAVSNVFDHTLRPSGELVCRGIQSQPTIGYLTQLEAMRYLEVGGFYKSPRFPVWVIGSTSHFSVMFGDSNALKESASDALLEKVRRAFKRMEGGAEENGFIQTNQLGDFLKSLALTNISDHEVQTLATFMDRYGAGIILWEDLWKRTSRLLTGASLESILNGTDEANSSGNNNSSIVKSEASNPNENQMTDEELARKLQAEWNKEDVDEIMPGSSLANTFDSGVSSVTTSTGSNQNTAPIETFGRTFQLYHYNGLRGGNFKVFRVTRLSAEEAIGASISLGGSNQVSHNVGGFGGELDAVLSTKWPSCKIDWLDGSPPSID